VRARSAEPAPIADAPRREPELYDLLEKGSRTFALTIPLLPQPLRDAMGIAYLLMRAADTLEDTEGWSRVHRITCLLEFAALTGAGCAPLACSELLVRIGALDCVRDAGHREVLGELPFLAEQLAGLPTALQAPILEHVERVARRMALWVDAHDDQERLELVRLRELDDYCYAVAGIVGEMITDLLAAWDPSLPPPIERGLQATAVDFGVGLQLVNILKDSWRDAQAGRRYVPRGFLPRGDGTEPERLDPVVRLALDRLSRGVEYTMLLPVQHQGVRRFCLLPLLLAGDSLLEVRRRAGELVTGGDVKIDRAAVMGRVAQTLECAGDNDAIRVLWAALRYDLELVLA